MKDHAKKAHKKLGELASTAICGNDITSSCLYVSALAIIYGGRWGPLALLLVGGVLYLFRSIYGEVVGALPLNGGAYNALLNTTTKFRASIAACLTILSYMATAVISASEGMHYLASAVESISEMLQLAPEAFPQFPVLGATIGLLAFFMCLTIWGIKESAVLAVGIFLFHIASLVLLTGSAVFYLSTHGLDVLITNLSTPVEGGMGKALLFGFCAAMLGISGFESSANFVEEQQEGVFPKTLRNMWIAVTVFNPLMALLALGLIPSGEIAHHETTLLADMGAQSAGPWVGILISVDAAIVLSGAVLTSFIGVDGLVARMTLDRCLPQFLIKKNRRGTTHRILIAFFILTISVLAITRGDLKALAGVYTLSFLSVMLLFGLGNILLKVKRASLPRPEKASWLKIVVAMLAVGTGLVGNATMNPQYGWVFLEYFIPAAVIVMIMLTRTAILEVLLFITRQTISMVLSPLSKMTHWCRDMIESINGQQIVFFTRGDNIANLNNVMLYVQKNEHTNRMKVVHITANGEHPPERLGMDLKFLDQAYPDIDIEYVSLHGTFGPELIRTLSKEWKIPANFMFIGCPGEGLPHSIGELDGVRVIV